MTGPDRAAHRTYEERHREIASETRARFRELATLLDLDPALRPAFISAGLRAAQFHAADCALADHELRSRQSWPAEDRAAREDIQERRWQTALREVRSIMEERAPAQESETPDPESRKVRTHYRPISTISRPPKG